MLLADAITSLRILANDTPTANNIRQETPVGKIDSMNRYYRLQNFPVVSGSVYITTTSAFRSQTGYTVDPANGIITYTAALVPPQTQFECDYNFFWFTDTDHTEFLNRGAEALGYAADATMVPVGLVTSMLHFALHHFWERRASQYAHKFASSGGQAGQSVEVVTKAFKALADTAMSNAIKYRDAFYTGQGRKEKPSSGVGSYSIDPGSPRR